MLVMRLLLGILKSDSDDIARAIIGLAHDRSSGYGGDIRLLRSDIESHLQLTGKSTDDPLVKVFRLLEHAALQGISFPSELVLYRKAFFTLEGVLNDIHPGFVMANSVEHYLRDLLLKEFPLRSAAWFMPQVDDAASYRSLLSTSDLQSLLVYRTFSEWRQLTEFYANMFGVSFNLAADWLSLMAGVRKD
jgi:ubiquinone biosynthesis protein